MGGSLGAVALNSAVETILDKLLKSFDIVHIRGNGNINAQLTGKKGYRQFEYVSEDLPDIFAASSIAVSRAGANAGI